MTNYSQWHTETTPAGKKVNSVEEIATQSEKVDALINLVANKNAHVHPNGIPFPTLIEQNDNAIDVNFISRNNFNNNAYRGDFNARPYPGNSSNGYGNSYGNYYGNPSTNNKLSSQLDNTIKN